MVKRHPGGSRVCVRDRLTDMGFAAEPPAAVQHLQLFWPDRFRFMKALWLLFSDSHSWSAVSFSVDAYSRITMPHSTFQVD